MKKIHLLFLVLIAAALVPWLSANAQLSESDISVDDTFLYRFDLVLRAGALEQTGVYQIESGDVPPSAGSWRVVIEGPRGQELVEQSFSMSSGRSVVLVRYQPNGTNALVFDSENDLVSRIPIEGSRVCDEDNLCEAQFGENTKNCRADCGSGYAQVQTAAVLPQSGLGKQVGALLLGLVLAAAGLLLVRGLNGILDRRSGPYDNA